MAAEPAGYSVLSTEYCFTSLKSQFSNLQSPICNPSYFPNTSVFGYSPLHAYHLHWMLGTQVSSLPRSGPSTPRPARVQRVPVSLSLNGQVSGEIWSA